MNRSRTTTARWSGGVPRRRGDEPSGAPVPPWGCPGGAGEGAEAHGSQERPGVAGQAGVRVGRHLVGTLT